MSNATTIRIGLYPGELSGDLNVRVPSRSIALKSSSVKESQGHLGLVAKDKWGFGTRCAVALCLSIALHVFVLGIVSWPTGNQESVGAARDHYAIKARFVTFKKTEPLMRHSPADELNGPVSSMARSTLKATGTKEDTSSNSTTTSPGNIFGSWYYPSRYLHRHPTPLKPINPTYPLEASSISGHVLLLLYIGFDGKVDKYEVVESTPKDTFDASAIEAFTDAQYAPGLITGYAVRSQLQVEVTYEPGILPQATLLAPEQE